MPRSSPHHSCCCSDADLQTDELRIPDQQQLRELAPTVVEIFKSSDYVYPLTLWPDGNYPHSEDVFEVFPEGKFDRYYLTFSEAHGITSGTSSDDTVSLRIDSPTVAVLELSEGYDMNPGTTFSIELE